MKLLVLQAGTNNVEACSVEQMVTGVRFLIAEIQRRRPDVEIILFGLAPRDSQRKKLSNETLLERIKEVNVELEKTPGIRLYVDIFDQFLHGDKKDPKKYDDHVHFNSIGYGIFAKAIVGAVDSVLNPE
eukprot:CAMPEP_0117012806 /NCGR_PEP_ID=MMETSP0472-20121206/10695_1 /TAXON_ID=693140 ORGANISM="Tiarina fusus, Strain LIS" /NCGR_SAMPLE_ID=MMETSP0472 /ASSEMBLY_ACC=CAM_ASM_000603 /LENGTH=128 /DNA_ID=CAMNT_0004715961 /DNA_START=266 /DNA_END=652 /DNA_ORIENTATION=+